MNAPAAAVERERAAEEPLPSGPEANPYESAGEPSNAMLASLLTDPSRGPESPPDPEPDRLDELEHDVLDAIPDGELREGNGPPPADDDPAGDGRGPQPDATTPSDDGATGSPEDPPDAGAPPQPDAPPAGAPPPADTPSGSGAPFDQGSPPDSGASPPDGPSKAPGGPLKDPGDPSKSRARPDARDASSRAEPRDGRGSPDPGTQPARGPVVPPGPAPEATPAPVDAAPAPGTASAARHATGGQPAEVPGAPAAKPEDDPEPDGADDRHEPGEDSDGSAGADGLTLEAMPSFAAPDIMLPASDDEGHREIAAELIGAGNDGLQALTSAARGGAEDIQQSVLDERARLDDHAAAESQRVSERGRAARAQVQAAMAAARSRVVTAEETQRGALEAWRREAVRQAGQDVTAAQKQARQTGRARGDEAVKEANDAGSNARRRIEGGAQEAVRIGETKVRTTSAPRPEIFKAKAAAARQVADDTASEITRSVEDTVKELRGLGPETRPEFVASADEFATSLGQGLPALTRELDSVGAKAAAAVGSAARAGSGGISAVGTSVLRSLTALERSVRAALAQQAATSRGALAATGGQAVFAMQEQHTAAAQAGADLIATVYASLPNRELRRAAASRLGGELGQQVRAGFSSSEAKARAAAATVAQSFAIGAAEARTALTQSATQADQQMQTTAGEGRGKLTAQQAQVVAQLVAAVTGAKSEGDAMVAGAKRKLTSNIDDVDKRFIQAVLDLRAALAKRTDEAVKTAREPLGTLEDRIDTAMTRAEDKMDDNWFERQLEDIKDSVNWGFIAGLVVGLLVTILVVALIGTGIGALVVAGALSGALSVAASTVTEDLVHNRKTDWGKLGKDMAIGGLFGAAGGLVGGGVTAALGNAVKRKIITEVGALAAGKVGGVIVGAATGAVQNAVNGDPWDKGLLLNLGVSIGMTYSPGAKYVDRLTQGARNRAVDSGKAFFVSPAETNAKSMRLNASSGKPPPPPPEQRIGAGPKDAPGPDVPSPAGDAPEPLAGSGVSEPEGSGRPPSTSGDDATQAASTVERGESTPPRDAGEPGERSVGGPPVPEDPVAPSRVDEELTGGRSEGSEPSKASDGPEQAAEPSDARPSEPPDGKGAQGEVVDGERVVAEAPGSEGHEVKVTEDGRCLVCSICEDIRVKYEKELGARPDLDTELRRAAGGSADASAKAKAMAEVQKKLAEARSEAWKAETPKAKLADFDTMLDGANKTVERLEKLLADPELADHFKPHEIDQLKLELEQSEKALRKAERDGGGVRDEPELLDIAREELDTARAETRRLELKIADRKADPPIKQAGEFKYQLNTKHDRARGNVSGHPSAPVRSLESSILVKDSSSARVNVDAASGEFVVFQESFPGTDIYHGYAMKKFSMLRAAEQAALDKAGLVTRKGKIL